MSFGRQRGRWGNIAFQSASGTATPFDYGRPGDEAPGSGHDHQSKTFDPPPSKKPGKGPYSNPLALVPGSMLGSSQTAGIGFGASGGGGGGSSRAFCGLGKRRARDEDDYFNDDDEVVNEEDLQYQPAPGSPSAHLKSAQDDQNDKAKERERPDSSDDEDDPLEKFMSGIENEVRSLQDSTHSKTKESKAAAAKGIRDDIEAEDEMEAYMRFMEENPNLGLIGDEDEIYEYDEEGNVIATEKKVIDPLPAVDHSEINYPPFEKNFYIEPEDIVRLNFAETDDLRKKLGLHVSGMWPPKPICAFAHFGFDEKMFNSVRKMGYTQPTPIQAQGVPVAMSGRDVIGIAKTGSGKTAAYLWPLLIHIMDQPELKPGDGPIGLICAPTRELAQQIYNEARKFSKVYNIHVVCAYGGGSMWEQQKACEEGCEILVCTPGRLIDLVKKKSTNLRRVTYLIYDEADKMFNMGFEPQVRSIANNVRPDRQTLLFSATFKKRVERLARDILTDPIRIIQGELGEANEDVTQIVEVFDKQDNKWDWLLRRLVEYTSVGSVLIFVTRKLNSEEVAQRLKAKDFQLGLIHGDMHQAERNTVIHAFKKQEYPILVATDVAARGLDIPSIRTVINFDVARDIDTHTHRIGRTGRAGTKGTAYTLVTKERDREFAAQLVRNLEGANQMVPRSLLELAEQNAWFKKNRFNTGDGKKLASYSMRSRPGFGSSERQKGQSSELPTVASARGGPQTDRLAAVKSAFSNQYSRMFVSAGVESTRYLHPERVGQQHTNTCSNPFSIPDPKPAPHQPPSSSPQNQTNSKRKKSRWD